MDLNEGDFQYVCDLVQERSAIVLDEGKEYLVEARLTPLARREGLGSVEEMVTRLRTQPFNKLHVRVVEAMTTNETSWFRDLHPFEALKKVILPELAKHQGESRTLSIWCAACSSGQEPYSIALLLREHFPNLEDWDVRIVASEISSEMLDRAREGLYSQLEVNRGLPAPLLVKYFQKNGLEWQLREEVRRMVEFHMINLINVWPVFPPMDIIFMRNVLIYFEVETKKTILGKVRRALKPNGYFFLGGAETTFRLDDSFEKVTLEKAMCFRLRGR